jgi:hypothetical protein
LKLLKRIALAVFALLLLGAGGTAIYVTSQTAAYDASADKVYDIPLSQIARSSDADVVARGKHLLESVGGCADGNCHGSDLAGGKTIEMGPVATFTAPNVTQAGAGAAYSDAELFRLLRHGVRRDGRSVRFMPVQDFAWMSDADLIALISYMRTMPPVEKANGPMEIKTLGKVLDRKSQLIIDVARRVPHEKPDLAPPPSPTKEYGAYVAHLCNGCHGEHLSGGPIPGAPSNMAVPKNLTPDGTGLQGWTFETFDNAITNGVSKDGRQLDALMPTKTFGKMSETEKHALFAYLQSVPPVPYGHR